MRTTLGESLGGSGQRQRFYFTFVGKEIGRECLFAVLGIGINRLRKGLNLIPDGRVGLQKSGSHRDTASVDAFLSVLYEGLAETLPDRWGLIMIWGMGDGVTDTPQQIARV